MKRDRQSVDVRRAKILSMLRERQKIKVEELAGFFDVSQMTIRRDLQELEDRGMVGRFYGGASMGPHTFPVSEKNDVAVCRQIISRYAASLVSEGDHLFINGSGTALDLLDYVGDKSISVFTNNGLAVGRKFPVGVEVTISGGSLRGQGAILTGDCTMRNLLMMQADKAFLGCLGISPGGEILCDIPTELGINETMISHAYQYYILADYTKVGKADTYASFSLEKPGIIITDELASSDVVERLRKLGMNVIQVGRDSGLAEYPVSELKASESSF